MACFLHEERNRLTYVVSDPSTQSPLVLAGGFHTWGVSLPLRMTIRGRMVSPAGGIAAFLEDGILVSQPSPLGEGAPHGRIG